MKWSRQSIVSLVLLIAASVSLRFLSSGEAIPLRQSFTNFPVQIGSWLGKDQELDTKVIQILRVDDYILRQYRDGNNTPIELYVGYYKSQREGATYHSPKHCLPGSGWTFVATDTAQLPGLDQRGKAIKINQFIIQKGLDKQLVLYWYQDRGRIITSEYWAKIYMIVDAMFRQRTDGAFVRITLPFTGQDEEVVAQRGRAFVEKIFPLLTEYLPS
jgi:EpsI family protein